MSTQVNVTQENGGQQLVDRVKEQQGAGRFAFQDKQATKAEGQKAQRRAPGARSQDGAAVAAGSGAGATSPADQGPDQYTPVPIKDELAANRFGSGLAGGVFFYTPSLFFGAPEKFTMRTMAAAGGYPTYTKAPPATTEGQYLEIEYTPEWVGDTPVDPPAPTTLGYSDKWTYHYETILPAGGKNIIVAIKYSAIQAWFLAICATGPVTTFEDSGIRTSNVTRAFVVSPTKIRELDVPLGLKNCLDYQLPDFASNVTTSEIQETGPYGIPAWVPPATCEGEQRNLPYFLYNKFLDDNLPYRNVNPTTLSFVNSFGLGLYRWGQHNQFGRCYSPSAIALLKGDLALPNTTSVTSYETMRELLGVLPLPNSYRAIDDPLLDDYVANTKTKYASIPPYLVTDFLTPLDTTAFAERISDVQIRATDNVYNYATFSYAWDWGKPLYCRQQLFDLGFTAADLRP